MLLICKLLLLLIRDFDVYIVLKQAKKQTKIQRMQVSRIGNSVAYKDVFLQNCKLYENLDLK